jgi:hypothetical protein
MTEHGMTSHICRQQVGRNYNVGQQTVGRNYNVGQQTAGQNYNVGQQTVGQNYNVGQQTLKLSFGTVRECILLDFLHKGETINMICYVQMLHFMLCAEQKRLLPFNMTTHTIILHNLTLETITKNGWAVLLYLLYDLDFDPSHYLPPTQGFKGSCEVSTTATIQFRKPSQLDDFY